MLIDCQECEHHECFDCPVEIGRTEGLFVFGGKAANDKVCPICSAYYDDEGFCQCDEQE